MALAGGSGSGWWCSSGFGSSGSIRAGGGEPAGTRLGLWRGGLGFRSRFMGDLRRGDGDRDFLLWQMWRQRR